MLKTVTSTFTFLFLFIISASSQKDIMHFTKIVSGPRISLVLEKGNSETVRFDYDNVTEDKLEVYVKNKTLRIHLEGSKNWEKQKKIKTHYGKYKKDYYQNVHVTAYITYTQLEKLVVKGEEPVSIDGPISADRFKLVTYGEQDVNFQSIDAKRFRVRMYGEGELYVGKGSIDQQKYTLYGEHDVDTKSIRSQYVVATNFGESDLEIDTDEVKVTSFGELDVYCNVDTKVRKFMTFGDTDINRYSVKKIK